MRFLKSGNSKRRISADSIVIPRELAHKLVAIGEQLCDAVCNTSANLGFSKHPVNRWAEAVMELLAILDVQQAIICHILESGAQRALCGYHSHWAFRAYDNITDTPTGPICKRCVAIQAKREEEGQGE